MWKQGSLFHRLDDIGTSDPRVEEFLENLDSIARPYVAAVIPACLSTHMARRIRTLRYCVVFQHGYSHENHSTTDQPDEFPTTMAASVIRRDVRAGRARLEDFIGVPVSGYVPPWNRASSPAVAILEECGFAILSAHSRAKYETAMLQMHGSIDPILCYRPLVCATISSLYDDILSIDDRAAFTGVIHHPMKYPAMYAKSILRWVLATADIVATAAMWNDRVGGGQPTSMVRSE